MKEERTMTITTRKPTLKNFGILTELILGGADKRVERQARLELRSLLSTANYLRDVDLESYRITEIWKIEKKFLR